MSLKRGAGLISELLQILWAIEENGNVNFVESKTTARNLGIP